ncbi:MAG: hypothetical protein JNL74_07280 [Fibrobacteres bacterium]|nr:hypothetical protein [Fibrobacterota bacterium]
MGKNSSCPVTGLEIIQKDEWKCVSADGKYNARFTVIGGRVIHSDVNGYTTIDISKQYLDLLDHICDTQIGQGRKAVLVENYSNHSGTSSEARNYYLSRQRKNERLKGVVFYQASSLFAMMIRVGRLFARLPFPIEITANYGEAMKTAISILNDFNRGRASTRLYITREEFDSEIDKLITYMGSINWKTPGSPGEDMSAHISDDFRPMYDALSIMKSDFDEKEHEKAAALQRTRVIQEQLHHAERMQTIGTLTGGIAHDFNNMMSAITGFATLLKKKHGAADPGIDRYAGLILETGNRASDLIQKLLAFARKGREEKLPICVDDIFENLSPMLQHMLNKKITVNYRFNDSAVRFMGDCSQIQNALLNLAINGVHAMPDGGTLTFGSRLVEHSEESVKELHLSIAPGTYLELSVTDTGTGISSEAVEHLFEPFFTTKGAGKGTGLGLTNVLGTVKHHGGSISFKSETGRGTTFNLYFLSVRNGA